MRTTTYVSQEIQQGKKDQLLRWIYDCLPTDVMPSILFILPIYGTLGAIYNMYKYIQYTWYT